MLKPRKYAHARHHLIRRECKEAASRRAALEAMAPRTTAPSRGGKGVPVPVLGRGKVRTEGALPRT